MIILEGCRRSGKSYTCDKIKEFFPDIQIYKDLGMRITHHSYPDINVDDYSVGRDLAYAQYFPTLPKHITNSLVVDRQYISSCVYGLYYRNNYDHKYWLEHLKKIEELYYRTNQKIVILFMTILDGGFKKIAEMDRKKDWLEDNSGEDGYRKQYNLYESFLKHTVFPVVRLVAFRDDHYIMDKVSEALALQY